MLIGRKWAALVGAAALMLVAAAMGCDGNLALAAPDAGADDAAPDAALPVLVVRVLAGADGADISTWQPVPGATIALDAPDGTRIEKIAGLDGRASFAGLDFSLGPAAVTALVSGPSATTLWSVLDISDAIAEVQILVWPDSQFGYVAVSGTASNMANPSHLLHVAAIPAATVATDCERSGTGYSLLAPANVPFTLVGLEYTGSASGPYGRNRVYDTLRWVLHPNVVADGATVVDLDFAQPMTPQSVDGTCPLPDRADSVLRTEGVFWAAVWSGLFGGNLGGQIGHFSLSEVNADTTAIDYTMKWIEPPSVTRPVTHYALVGSGYDAPSSFVLVEGYPQAGDQNVVFLDYPEVVSPAPDGTAHPLHDPIAWTQHDAASRGSAYLSRIFTYGTTTLWAFEFAAGRRTVTIPTPPSTVDQATLFGSDPLSFIVGEVDRVSPTTMARLSLSGAIQLSPQ